MQTKSAFSSEFVESYILAGKYWQKAHLKSGILCIRNYLKYEWDLIAHNIDILNINANKCKLWSDIASERAHACNIIKWMSPTCIRFLQIN